MDRMMRFLTAAVALRGEKVVGRDETTLDLIGADGARRVRFTRSREAAAGTDELELLIVHKYIDFC
jgi:hypothetical protein